MPLKIAVHAGYALIIIIVGIRGLRATKSFSDFFLGGGNVGGIYLTGDDPDTDD
jgi:SSS family solute:Na+ symporter/sodium/proline symporter